MKLSKELNKAFDKYCNSIESCHSCNYNCIPCEDIKDDYEEEIMICDALMKIIKEISKWER